MENNGENLFPFGQDMKIYNHMRMKAPIDKWLLVIHLEASNYGNLISGHVLILRQMLVWIQLTWHFLCDVDLSIQSFKKKIIEWLCIPTTGI